MSAVPLETLFGAKMQRVTLPLEGMRQLGGDEHAAFGIAYHFSRRTTGGRGRGASGSGSGRCGREKMT